MRVVFATAELEPIVSTGGLGAASAGLVRELRAQGVEVDVAVPDYSTVDVDGVVEVDRFALDVPEWVGGAHARVVEWPGVGRIHLIGHPTMPRPNPYVDVTTGHGWGDNDHRFFAWSAAVARLVDVTAPDVVHVNDWHSATVLGHLAEDPIERPATVLSIHNLAHQGAADAGWTSMLGPRRDAYVTNHGVNALAGAVALADRVVTVSPRYAEEIRGDWGGMGLAGALRDRGPALLGILNGIDTEVWNPATDRHLVQRYDVEAVVTAKAENQAALCDELGLDGTGGPLLVVVSRFDHQKAIDLLLDVVGALDRIPYRVAILGAGDRFTEDRAQAAASDRPGRFVFRRGYDAALAHRMFAAGDLTIVPSRFEPCGLTQMQAMRYGTIPIVSDVGGLHDTVIDADAQPRKGTGIVMWGAEAGAVVDGLHRGARLWANRSRRASVIKRGMTHDWSWTGPAERYSEVYREVTAGPGAPTARR